MIKEGMGKEGGGSDNIIYLKEGGDWGGGIYLKKGKKRWVVEGEI